VLGFVVAVSSRRRADICAATLFLKLFQVIFFKLFHEKSFESEASRHGPQRFATWPRQRGRWPASGAAQRRQAKTAEASRKIRLASACLPSGLGISSASFGATWRQAVPKQAHVANTAL